MPQIRHVVLVLQVPTPRVELQCAPIAGQVGSVRQVQPIVVPAVQGRIPAMYSIVIAPIVAVVPTQQMEHLCAHPAQQANLERLI